MTAFSEDSLSAIATKLGTLLMLDSYTSDMCIQSWGMSRNARVLIEIRADVELKDNIVVAMPKLADERFYSCNDECPKNLDAEVVKNMKKHSQTPRGVLVGPKVGFKPVKQVYRQVEKINKMKILIIEGKVTLVDGEGKPLINGDSSGDHDSEDEVASVHNDIAYFLASTKDGYGINSLLEQWKEFYVNGVMISTHTMMIYMKARIFPT
nr:hypothetical protein [Tanacetum cinerariifolium]